MNFEDGDFGISSRIFLVWMVVYLFSIGLLLVKYLCNVIRIFRAAISQKHYMIFCFRIVCINCYRVLPLNG
jgi:hypothetical protein